jgi:hypothetical protein
MPDISDKADMLAISAGAAAEVEAASGAAGLGLQAASPPANASVDKVIAILALMIISFG